MMSTILDDETVHLAGKPHVVAVPYPLHGHVNPMFALCRLLASRGAIVTFVVTEEWLDLLGGGGAADLPPTLRFRTIPNVIPSERVRRNDVWGFVDAVSTKMEGPFERLVMEGMEPPVRLLLTDVFLAWAMEVGRRRGVPVAALWTQAAVLLLAQLRLGGILANGQIPNLNQGKENGSLSYLPRYDITQTLESDLAANNSPLVRSVASVACVNDKVHYLLLSSIQELEPKSIDELKQIVPCPVYPVGPSVPYMALEQDPPARPMGTDQYYFPWLDSQPRSSVLYISLGSFMPVSCTQMEEIAKALRSTGTRFLCVARSETSHVQEVSGNKGLVVPWCDQLRVLCHPSVGGFLTHCGWNSVQEGVYAGVPMLVFPLFWDQYPNCRLVVDEWGIGLRLKEEANGADLVEEEKLARNMRCLMDEDEGRELRRRASELKEACRKAVRDGGSTSNSLDAFIKGFSA